MEAGPSDTGSRRKRDAALRAGQQSERPGQRPEHNQSCLSEPGRGEPRASRRGAGLESELSAFSEFGSATRLDQLDGVTVYTNEYWTARQRAAHSLHEVSYRACFKPQLPRFFIDRLSEPGDAVYDPFLGRGTTALEAALAGRTPYGCDVNPLSAILLRPRLHPPGLDEVSERLGGIDWSASGTTQRTDLLVFYHPETLRELTSLRDYLRRRDANGELDSVDDWIRMVAVNRLTGHSSGFFSVYTLPPNQAVSVESQRRINEKRDQSPSRRDVPALILRKSRSLLADCDDTTRSVLADSAPAAILLSCASDSTPQLADESVELVVTSPPFLDVIDYAQDNWLRCWFAGIDVSSVRISVLQDIDAWREMVAGTLRELGRVLKPGGHVVFEVGEVRGGKVKLEQIVLEAARAAGALVPRLVLINEQAFTKTANIWGVGNNKKGTNTNRIVLLEKPRATF